MEQDVEADKRFLEKMFNSRSPVMKALSDNQQEATQYKVQQWPDCFAFLFVLMVD